MATILPIEPSRPSLSRKGNFRDNAVAESFLSTLKKERIKKQIYKNRERTIADVGAGADRVAPGAEEALAQY